LPLVDATADEVEALPEALPDDGIPLLPVVELFDSRALSCFNINVGNPMNLVLSTTNSKLRSHKARLGISIGAMMTIVLIRVLVIVHSKTIEANLMRSIDLPDER